MSSKRPNRYGLAAARRRLVASSLTAIGVGLSEAASAGNLPVPCVVAGACGTNTNVPSWVGAVPKTVGNTLTVNQSTATQTFNWQSFNIASGATVNFRQPSATAVAINNIFQGTPSEIFGALTANGRIYLINQNGIVFGAGAQVNVGSLVASTLNITENAIANGIAATSAGDPTTPSFVNFLDANGNVLASGPVTVASGATLNATGGQIFLFAPQISNQGKITTADGQTILAAGNAIYLATSPDANLRGLLVAVDAGGTVTNGTSQNAHVTDPSQLVGQIIAAHGNVTLMGLAVNQQGLVSANTSVRANGSIFLIASDRSTAGTLTLGANSATLAGLDISDTTLGVDATTQQKSNIALQGDKVDILGGAAVTATSGTITVSGSATAVEGSTDIPTGPQESLSDGSRIYVAPGATLDVSGATADLPMSSNVLQVQLRGSELADDPEQRNGALRGQTVNVDVRQYGTLNGAAWVGTPLADLSADFATIQRGIDERNETGGTVTLQSSGDVIVSSGARINASGGQSDYQGGFLNTSSVLGANGQLYNIANASPTQVYVGVANTTSFSVTDPRWGVTTTYPGIFGGQGQYEAAYVQGADAGSVAVSAPNVILDGNLLANVVAGQFQRKPPAGPLPAGDIVRPYDQLPEPASLTLGPGTSPASPFTPPDLILTGVDIMPGPVLPTLKNPGGTAFNPLVDPWPSGVNVTVLSPTWIGPNAGGQVTIDANAVVSIPAGIDLHLPPGGSFSVLANSVDVAGTIAGAGTSITLQTLPTQLNLAGAANIVLAPSAILNTSGAWVNDDPQVTAPPATAPLTLSGGTVKLAARDGNVTLAPGSIIDVSGGAQLEANGTFNPGSAGAISISTSAPDTVTATLLTLGAALQAYAFAEGGTLSLSASGFCLTSGAPCGAVTAPGTLALQPSFFTTGGFSNFWLNANFGGIELATQTEIYPQQSNFLANVELPFTASAPTIAALHSVATGVLPNFERQPSSLTLSSEYTAPLGTDVSPQTFASASNITLDRGARIELDPTANLSLSSNTSIVDDAVVVAPAGSVSMTVTAALAEPVDITAHEIWLGPDSIVNVAGAVQSVQNDIGAAIGNVLPGGTVSLTADRGLVETLPGSQIDLAGIAASLDVARTSANGKTTYQLATIASAGGTLDLVAADAVILNGALSAASGDPSTVPSGSFSLVLDGNTRYSGNLFPNSAPPYSFTPRTIDVAASQSPVIVGVGIDLPESLEGTARVSGNALMAAGFDSVSLQAVTLNGFLGPTVPGVIEFDGNLALRLGRSLILDSAGFLSGGGNAVLSAPYVSLGQSPAVNQTTVGAATAGPGMVQVNAQFIDLNGNTAFGNLANLTLNSSGDIRADGIEAIGAPGAALDPQLPGSLSVSGSLNLIAQQIYPSTLTAFTITSGAGGSGDLTIEAAPGTAPSPLLSAGGALIFNAPHIVQAGTVRAPIGNITMNASSITLSPGSVTSTSADGQTIPFGVTEGGFDWIYPFGPNQALVYGTDGIPLPSQTIQLSAASIIVAKNATIDVKGGGDLLATEFVPGPTGTIDVLSESGSFAILPAANLRFAPYDPYNYTNADGVEAPPSVLAGQSVYLSGGGGVPAGVYAILPAHYALLPGAYYVTPVSGYQDLTPGQAIAQPDGSTIVAGYDVFATTGLGSSRTSGFDVVAGTAVQNLAQYTLSTANSFFTQQAKSAGVVPQRLPEDAGYIDLSASNQLTLDGTLEAAAASGGRGADVDISSAAILVVNGNAPATNNGILNLSANSLNALGAESILIGGTRTETLEGLAINADAATVEVASGVVLTGPEFLLAATNTVTIDPGATVSATGTLPSPDTAILVSGDGALLRVAAGGNPTITRSGSDGLQGEVVFAPGSIISAPKGSVAVDAAASAAFGGQLELSDGTLAISGNQVSVGNAPAGTTGIVLPSAVLEGLSLADLSLASATSIDIYDGANVTATNLTLNLGALRGFEQGSVQLAAGDTLTLTGAPRASSLAGSGTGTGTLTLVGGQGVVLQAGTIDISGFSKASLTSQGPLTLTGAGSLSVEGNLGIQAEIITAESGASNNVNVSGSFNYEQSTPASKYAAPTEAPLGASFAITAQSIDFDGAATLHSGSLTLVATGTKGNVALGQSADIDLSSVVTAFDSVAVDSRAGSLTLQSQQGSVTAAASSVIDVSTSSEDGAAVNSGSLQAQAANGNLGLIGQLLGRDASVNLDAQSLGNVPALESALVTGGFTGDWTLRLRGAGDIDVPAGAERAITARSVSLTADQGNIDVDGRITTASLAGGTITLSASNNIIVDGLLDARPQTGGENNGQILLESTQGRVVVSAAATIEAFDPATPVQSAADGGLWIRESQASLATLLSGPASTAGLVLAGNLKGLNSVTIEGFQAYANTTGSLGAADVAAEPSNPLWQGAANFMATAPALLQALGTIKGPTPQIVPGVEIDSTQTLALNSAWDLSAWRFNGVAGVLTLRAAGDLDINASISDGFNGVSGADAYILTATGRSWSYRLAAGADLNSSSPLGVLPQYAVAADTNGTGSLTLAGGVRGGVRPDMTMIRTGTGSISIAAAGDVTLTNADSVIYTAGIAETGVTFSGRGQLAGLLYPTSGGDISISAGQDVIAAVAPTDLVTNWLWRVGSPDARLAPATAWTVNFADFEAGIGALGGGNVTVSAARDIDDLSVSVPTVGRQVGGLTLAQNQVQVLNQGDITIRAGNDVAGGTVYEGSGVATVVAGNQITVSPTVAGLYPMILLGNGSVDLSAGHGATLAGVANPTILPQGIAQAAFSGNNYSYFSTYGENSAVNLQTVSGAAELLNDTSSTSAVVNNYTTLAYDTRVISSIDPDTTGVSSERIYPGTVDLAALRGGLTVDNTMTLYPNATGSLELLAHDSVQLGALRANAASSFEIIESNSDLTLLPTPTNPQGNYQTLAEQLATAISSSSQIVQNAAVPVHLGAPAGESPISRIIALTGDVSMLNGSSESQLFFAAPARVVAGQDVSDLTVDFTNVLPTDVSAVVAGRDITYPFSRDAQGQFTLVSSYIDIDGPGTLAIVAGRDLNLGTSNGITSRGNLSDPGLASQGANVSVEAGVGNPNTTSYSTFIGDYLTPTGLYAQALIDYMQSFIGGSPTEAQALDAFKLLPTREQAPLIQTVFFDELLASGSAAAANGPLHDNFTRGYEAIQALFPGGVPTLTKTGPNPYVGDLTLYFSRIYTLDGGDINLSAPGGNIDVGLASPPASFGITKQPSDLGIVAQSTGSVNAYSYGNFEVNESRVFAADGGNILIWSTQGNIDAGRGAKTAISAPPPTITYLDGVPTVTFAGALDGSGIQTLATTPGVSPGNVGLFAPNGVVNANDAGIVAGNLTIAATAVLGAGNIKVSGVSIGVPVEATGLGASLAAVSAVGSSASEAATASVVENANRATAAPIAEAAIGWLDVFLEGFGPDVCKPQDLECIKRQPTGR